MLSRVDYLILSAMTALSVLILAAAGRFAPEITPDTGGYLAALDFPNPLAHPRAPFYGWLIAVLDFGRGRYIAVPAFQIATYFAAAWLFVAALRGYGLSRRATLSVGVALLFGNALLLVSHNVHPEFPAITCALLAFAGTVHLAAPRPRWWGDRKSTRLNSSHTSVSRMPSSA